MTTTDSISASAGTDYHGYCAEAQDDFDAMEQDALFEACERRSDELDQLVQDGMMTPHERVACVPGARRGLLR